MRVLIGVDPHKHSHTAAVLDQRGELLAQQRFLASREGHRALRRFANAVEVVESLGVDRVLFLPDEGFLAAAAGGLTMVVNIVRHDRGLRKPPQR